MCGEGGWLEVNRRTYRGRASDDEAFEVRKGEAVLCEVVSEHEPDRGNTRTERHVFLGHQLVDGSAIQLAARED